jgi:hypothetical protein
MRGDDWLICETVWAIADNMSVLERRYAVTLNPACQAVLRGDGNQS